MAPTDPIEARPAAEPLLSVTGLSVSYGHVNALKDASLEVFRGEIVVLIGANGAGKTTLLESVLGINPPTAGEIRFKGAPITGRPRDRNVRAGICLVPEGRGVFASMSVLDNLLLGAHHNMRNADAQPAARLRVVPDPEATPGPGGAHPDRRRAADARHRARAHVRARAHHGRRAVHRPGADRRQRHLLHPRAC